MKIEIVQSIENVYKEFLEDCDNAPPSNPMRLAFFLILREQAAWQGADKEANPRDYRDTTNMIDHEIQRLIREIQR